MSYRPSSELSPQRSPSRYGIRVELHPDEYATLLAIVMAADIVGGHYGTARTNLALKAALTSEAQFFSIRSSEVNDGE